MALEPKSRRLLALELSWMRRGAALRYVMVYLFLRKLKLRKGKLWHKDYRFVADRAPWYGIASELGLRLIHDGSLLKPPERLSKEVKRRLKDFSSTFTILPMQMP
ncbi:hypothetical protein KEJ19_02065 [Candidatus Bathyarchaeota archaeon]|nr:hypothetical protein [Candidatus Bathyarchaeota archaeon]